MLADSLRDAAFAVPADWKLSLTDIVSLTPCP